MEVKVSVLVKKVKVSAEFAKFLDVSEISRSEVTKKVWDYIKKHNLQDPKDKRVIIPDAALAIILGSEPINMMKMPAALNMHFIVEPKKAKVAPAPKESKTKPAKK